MINQKLRFRFSTLIQTDVIKNILLYSTGILDNYLEWNPSHDSLGRTTL